MNSKYPSANYQYLLIVLLLAFFAGGGIFAWQYLSRDKVIQEWQLPKMETLKRVSSGAIPVLVLSFFPLTNQNKLDTNITGEIPPCYNNCGLGEVRSNVSKITEDVVKTLEKGSIYHGYKDPEAIPYLDYKIYETKEFLYPIPKSAQFPPFADHTKIPAFHKKSPLCKKNRAISASGFSVNVFTFLIRSSFSFTGDSMN